MLVLKSVVVLGAPFNIKPLMVKFADASKLAGMAVSGKSAT